MKFNINYKGQEGVIQMKPAEYQGKQMYEVHYDNQFVMVYEDGSQWCQDNDHDYDPEGLNTVGSLIDNLAVVNANNLV
jgi:hypothetical protein